MTAALFIAGSVLVCVPLGVGVWATFVDFRPDVARWLVVVLAAGAVAGLGLLVAGAVVFDQHESASCAAKGGHEVPDGAPYYVRSGSILLPIQGTKCVTS